MKAMKTLFLVIMAVFVLATLSTKYAQADNMWLMNAKVTGAGPSIGGTGIVLVRLTDTTSTPPIDNVQFRAKAEIKKEILGTALTAVSLDKSVTVLLSGSAANSDILYLSINNR